MSENKVGKAIKEAFLFLQPIFSDTARLMKIVEDRMNRHKLTALWGSSSVWGRSQAYYGGHGWIAHYLNRLFVRSLQKDEKPSFKEKKGAFINVYFAPEKFSQPIVVYGAIQSADENIWSVWESLMAVNTGPEFVTSEKVHDWTKYEKTGHPTLTYKVLPLIDMTNKEMVESMCDEAFEMLNRAPS